MDGYTDFSLPAGDGNWHAHRSGLHAADSGRPFRAAGMRASEAGFGNLGRRREQPFIVQAGRVLSGFDRETSGTAGESAGSFDMSGRSGGYGPSVSDYRRPSSIEEKDFRLLQKDVEILGFEIRSMKQEILSLNNSVSAVQHQFQALSDTFRGFMDIADDEEKLLHFQKKAFRNLDTVSGRVSRFDSSQKDLRKKIQDIQNLATTRNKRKAEGEEEADARPAKVAKAPNLETRSLRFSIKSPTVLTVYDFQNKTEVPIDVPSEKVFRDWFVVKDLMAIKDLVRSYPTVQVVFADGRTADDIVQVSFGKTVKNVRSLKAGAGVKCSDLQIIDEEFGTALFLADNKFVWLSFTANRVSYYGNKCSNLFMVEKDEWRSAIFYVTTEPAHGSDSIRLVSIGNNKRNFSLPGEMPRERTNGGQPKRKALEKKDVAQGKVPAVNEVPFCITIPDEADEPSKAITESEEKALRTDESKPEAPAVQPTSEPPPNYFYFLDQNGQSAELEKKEPEENPPAAEDASLPGPNSATE